jgi:type IV pilus assembly protein PilC
MPNYFYTAKSIDGEVETGTMNAENMYEIAEAIRGKGLFLIDATTNAKLKKPAFKKFDIMALLNRVSLNEKVIMTRNIGAMISTGLPLIKIFSILERQSKNPTLKKTLAGIQKDINRGETLSDAMSKYPSVFSEFFVSMVRIGEESGTLDEVFNILAFHFSRQHETSSKIKNAMIYPVLILMVMFCVITVMVVFVIPNLNTFFVSLDAQLPIYTVIMLAAGNFLATHWYLMLMLPVVAVITISLVLRIEMFRRLLDTVLIKLPIVSPVVKKKNSAFLIRSLSSLISAGVSLTRALEISSTIVTNHYFVDAMKDSVERIKKGEKLSATLRVYQDIFPFGVIEMVEVGEETGKTAEILKKLADFYEEEVASAVEKLTNLIEPLLIIVMGLGVAFFAISIIQPMYSTLRVIG